MGDLNLRITHPKRNRRDMPDCKRAGSSSPYCKV